MGRERTDRQPDYGKAAAARVLLAAAVVASGAVGPARASAAGAFREARAAGACVPLANGPLQSASAKACVVVLLGGGWSVRMPGAWLTLGARVSAVQLPDALVWLSAPTPWLPGRRPRRSRRWELFVTPGAAVPGSRQPRDVAAGARPVAVLGADVARATLDDAGEGVAVVTVTTKAGDTEVLALSYAHPGAVTRLVTVAGRSPATSWPVVRHGVIAVMAYHVGAHGVAGPSGAWTLAHVVAGRVASVRHVVATGRGADGWQYDGLVIDGVAVPWVRPHPVRREPGMTPVRIGVSATGPYVIDVPTGWRVRPEPGGSSYGVQATGGTGGRVTVWENGCVGCYAMQGLDLVGGPDTPVGAVPPGKVRWRGDHTVVSVARIREAGRPYVRLALATVPPQQGTYQVTVIVPAAQVALGWRVLGSFRWS